MTQHFQCRFLRRKHHRKFRHFRHIQAVLHRNLIQPCLRRFHILINYRVRHFRSRNLDRRFHAFIHNRFFHYFIQKKHPLIRSPAPLLVAGAPTYNTRVRIRDIINKTTKPSLYPEDNYPQNGPTGLTYSLHRTIPG